jgi:hypothetical protein
MKNLLVLTALGLLASPDMAAQQRWQTEVGVQGGFTRQAPPGMGKLFRIDLVDLPGVGGFGRTAVYVILPVREKIAIEPSFLVSQGSYGNGFTRAMIVVRGDYAFTPRIYGAAGGTLDYADNDAFHATKLGVQFAGGYRFGLGSTLRGRVEIQWQYFKEPAYPWWNNNYSLLLGLAAPTHGAALAPRQARPSGRSWEPAIGIQGGYSRVHIVQYGSYAFLTLPGWGNSNATSMEYVPGFAFTAMLTPPTLFAVVPLGSRMAIEPALDVHREKGGGTLFTGNFSVRLDYAVSDHWYGAAGGNLAYFKAPKGYLFFNDPTITSTTKKGVNVAWGYRFGFGHGLGGRLEASYVMMKQSVKLIGPQANNITNISFAVTAPLK